MALIVFYYRVRNKVIKQIQNNIMARTTLQRTLFHLLFLMNVGYKFRIFIEMKKHDCLDWACKRYDISLYINFKPSKSENITISKDSQQKFNHICIVLT